MIGRDSESIARYLDWLGSISAELAFRGSIPFIGLVEGSWRSRPASLHLGSFSTFAAWLWILEPEIDATFPRRR